jgi:hypothetical protein
MPSTTIAFSNLSKTLIQIDYFKVLYFNQTSIDLLDTTQKYNFDYRQLKELDLSF